MFRKLNNVFRPNQAGLSRSEQDYHSACTVRLVRSTSVLVVGGERGQAAPGSTLKRSKSTSSTECALERHQRQEQRLCLEYLEALVQLRRTYTQTVGGFRRSQAEATLAPETRPAPPPPPRTTTPDPPDEEDSLRYLDAVIASCDSEAQRKPYSDDGHADVDFIVASTSAQHGLHSNWVLRVPRVMGEGEQKAAPDCANRSAPKKPNKSGSTSSRLRLQRNPIHLPKVVESALQTLRFKPRLKKH